MHRVFNPGIGTDVGDSKVMISIIGKRGLQLKGPVGILNYGFKNPLRRQVWPLTKLCCQTWLVEPVRLALGALGASNSGGTGQRKPAVTPAAFRYCRR